MSSEKKLFGEKLIEKANALRETVHNHLQSLQNINAFFTFETGELEKLSKKRHEILSLVWLLWNNGRKCNKSDMDKSLIKEINVINY